MYVIQGQREGFRQQVPAASNTGYPQSAGPLPNAACSPLISLRNRRCSKWTRARINNLGLADPACTPFSEQNPDTNSTNEQTRTLHKTCKHYPANRVIGLRILAWLTVFLRETVCPSDHFFPGTRVNPGGRRRGRWVCSPSSRNLSWGAVGGGGVRRRLSKPLLRRAWPSSPAPLPRALHLSHHSPGSLGS